MIFLDTNAVIWLYQAEIERFTPKTKVLLEENDLVVSPLVKLELQYLHEIKRIKKTAAKVLDELYNSIGLQLHNVPVTLLIEKALGESWTRDPFDRLITTHAKIEQSPLVTKDQTILAHYTGAVW